MSALLASIGSALGIPPTPWATSIAVVVLATVGYLLARLVVSRVAHETATRFYWQRGIGYALTLTVVVTLARTWVGDLSHLRTALGLVAAALVVALKDLLLDIVASIVILWRRLFLFGDRIRVGSHRGDVIDMSLSSFTLLEVDGPAGSEQSTGRVVRVPNGVVLHEAVTNYTQALPFIWAEISIVVTLTTDLVRAEALLLEIAAQHLEEAVTPETRLAHKMRQANIVYSRLTPVVYCQLLQDRQLGVRLSLRFLCRPRKRRDLESVVTRAVLTALAAEPNVHLAGQSGSS